MTTNPERLKLLIDFKHGEPGKTYLTEFEYTAKPRTGRKPYDIDVVPKPTDERRPDDPRM